MSLLYILFFLDMLNLAVFLPVFSPFIKSIGGTSFIFGILNSSSALVSLLWNPIVGSLSDQIGRKGLLIKCLWASAIGSLLMASSNSLIVAFLGKLIGSLGTGVGILLRSTVADMYKTEEEKKTFFNKCASFMSVGFLLGSVSSGFISERENGFSLAFLLMSVITGVASLIAKNILTDDNKSLKDRQETNQSIFNKGVKELKRALVDVKSITWFHYKRLFIIKAGYDFAITIIFTNIGFIMVEEFNLTGRYMGLVFLSLSIAGIVTNLLKLKLKSVFDRIPDFQLVITTGFILILSFVGMAISGTVLIFIFFMELIFVAKTFMDTTLTQLITAQVTEADRGKVLGAYENLTPLSGFIIPVISGLLAAIFGQRLLVLSAVIPMSLAIIVARKCHNKKD